jgi:hypothetical protein
MIGLFITRIAINESSWEGSSSDPIAVSSPSHRLSEPVADWIRKRVFLSGPRGSAVNLVLKEYEPKNSMNQLPLHRRQPVLDSGDKEWKVKSCWKVLFHTPKPL